MKQITTFDQLIKEIEEEYKGNVQLVIRLKIAANQAYVLGAKGL